MGTGMKAKELRAVGLVESHLAIPVLLCERHRVASVRVKVLAQCFHLLARRGLFVGACGKQLAGLRQGVVGGEAA
jgi:hypothetical protein